MQESIITVPLFSVDEKDVINKSFLQKTFQQAVSQMYNEGGMYVQCDRERHYLKTTSKIVKLEDVRFFVFGEVMKISDAKKTLGAKYPYLLENFEYFEELGFDELAYNEQTRKIIPFNDEQMVILSNRVAENLNRNQFRNSGSSREILYTEPLFKPLCFNQSDYDADVFSAILNVMKHEQGKFQGIEVFERIYFGDGSSEMKAINSQYVFEDSLVGKNLLREIFSQDKAKLRMIAQSPGEQMIMDNEKHLFPLAKACFPIRRMSFKKWLG